MVWSVQENPFDGSLYALMYTPNKTHLYKLKDEKWESYNRQLVTTCRAQNLENVLQPNYVPNDITDAELYDEQKKFMYAVFEKTIKTQAGINFVRKHHQSYDASRSRLTTSGIPY
mgnify:CR=1 FL=1